MATQADTQAAPVTTTETPKKEGFKVFVGNLSYKTKESELSAFFASNGEVLSANIISRGTRSLGYGFVEMANQKDAETAVTVMNKKELDSREINVELAKPRQEGEERPPRAKRGGRGRGGRGGNTGGRGGATPAPAGRGGRGRGRGGARRGRPTRKPRVAQGKVFKEKKENTDVQRTPSKTTLFVANLPFSLDDDGLTAVFKETKPESAYVVKRRNQRSKGFGFVTFANEADQQAALEKINKQMVDGRELSVRVALTNPEGTLVGGENNTPAEGAAPTSEKKSEETK